MKLRSLRVHGFKSFADPTEIQFHHGITTIVGPNGCGKSNISDAIRWVLGEQRPTAIRGARMEEAIFQGSVNRRPVGRGSVTMVVSNEDGSLPVPFEEVEIGRRVFRDGGSDYSINRAVVRLRDVLDLVRDTGLGANAYNVLENRMIEAILSDRAEERRALFEEAAGIGKYKDRRRSASRRLERAETDLQRLEDLIAEVGSKVRSLARQKGKAERFASLRSRRLSLEIAVVGHQLEALGDRVAGLEKELQGGRVTGEGMIAEARTAEARHEALRLEQVELEKSRARVALELDTVRGQLTRWEKDLAVAAERAAHAVRRLGQIEGEREEASAKSEAFTTQAEDLDEDMRVRLAELAEAGLQLEAKRARSEELRALASTARRALDSVDEREREIARRAAQLEGDAEAARSQAAELGRRQGLLSGELESASEALTDLETQGDLFTGRMQTLDGSVSTARETLARAEKELLRLRSELDAARMAEIDSHDVASSLGARITALEGMARDSEGMEPAVRAASSLGDVGVLGILSQFIEAPADLSRAVQSFLGPLGLALVVRDSETADRVRRWFHGHWEGGGGLIVLPLDRVPQEDQSGPLLGAVSALGDGAPWVRALLSGAELVEEDELLLGDGRATVRVTPSGSWTDARGIVRMGTPTGSSGMLEREARLQSLRADAKAAESRAAQARSERERLRERVDEAAISVEKARAAYHDADETHRAVRADLVEQVDRAARMGRHREDVARQIEGTKAARSRADARARTALKERASLQKEEAVLGEELRTARGALDGAEQNWEVARAEESALAVRVARLEGEAERLGERLESVREQAAAARGRLQVLDNEEDELRTDLRDARALEAEGSEALESLFARRDVAEQAVRERQEAVDRVADALRAAESSLRSARHAEREATDARHRLELELQETRGRIDRIRERLEGEWGRPLEDLLDHSEPFEEEMTREEMREELEEIVRKLERIGPVNMLAVEEHEEESRRLTFLRDQLGDLVEARSDLRAAIRRIDQTATELFMETFERIRENFRSIHRRLFEGGEADIWLGEEGDPLESPIEIHASPRGKKTQRIHLLSGGERALTALSLLFAIYLVKPSPFCVLDEVDAPLDENNIGRFIRLLDEFKEQTQFIVITHNPRTIEAADWIYGVTMEEPGVSSVVGVQLEDALERARGSAA